MDPGLEVEGLLATGLALLGGPSFVRTLVDITKDAAPYELRRPVKVLLAYTIGIGTMLLSAQLVGLDLFDHRVQAGILVVGLGLGQQARNHYDASNTSVLRLERDVLKSENEALKQLHQLE